MTRAAVAVGRKAVFKDVVERMEQWQVSALPVLEGDGRVIGVVSEAGLLPKEEFRTATRTGRPSCAGCPTSPRPGRYARRS